jgi:hypothetical protein
LSSGRTIVNYLGAGSRHAKQGGNLDRAPKLRANSQTARTMATLL